MAITTIALPTGRSLEAPTLELLEDARILVKRPHPRAIAAKVEGCPGIERAVFCRPSEIGKLVAEKAALFGITGKDVLIEHPQEDVEIYAEFPYSRSSQAGTRCVLFTRSDNPIGTLESLKCACADAQIQERVVSEYPVETRAFLDETGIGLRIRDDWDGSAEVLVHERKCLYGVALVETGTTLVVNGLKEIATIFESCTVLIGHKDARSVFPGGLRRPIGEFLPSLLRGTFEARTKVYLVMNAPSGNVEEIRAILPALRSPTVQPLIESCMCSVASLVPSSDVNRLMWQLQERGASGFVTLPPSTVM